MLPFAEAQCFDGFGSLGLRQVFLREAAPPNEELQQGVRSLFVLRLALGKLTTSTQTHDSSS